MNKPYAVSSAYYATGKKYVRKPATLLALPVTHALEEY